MTDVAGGRKRAIHTGGDGAQVGHRQIKAERHIRTGCQTFDHGAAAVGAGRGDIHGNAILLLADGALRGKRPVDAGGQRADIRQGQVKAQRHVRAGCQPFQRDAAIVGTIGDGIDDKPLFGLLQRAAGLNPAIDLRHERLDIGQRQVKGHIHARRDQPPDRGLRIKRAAGVGVDLPALWCLAQLALGRDRPGDIRVWYEIFDPWDICGEIDLRVLARGQARHGQRRVIGAVGDRIDNPAARFLYRCCLDRDGAFVLRQDQPDIGERKVQSRAAVFAAQLDIAGQINRVVLEVQITKISPGLIALCDHAEAGAPRQNRIGLFDPDLKVIRPARNRQIKHTVQRRDRPVQRKRRGARDIAASQRGKATDILRFERHLQLREQPGIHPVDRRLACQAIVFPRQGQPVDLNRFTFDETDFGAAGDRVPNGLGAGRVGQGHPLGGKGHIAKELAQTAKVPFEDPIKRQLRLRDLQRARV